ncbi:hypothetical protein ACP70R_022781 [Stipagrostis hirtigluma subsp. patula]
MDPQLKLLVDEMKKAMVGMEKSLADRIDGVEQSLGTRFEAVESAAASFDEWKPKVDAAVEDLQLEVGVLRKHFARVVLEREGPASGIFSKAEAGSATPPAGNQSVGPNGHRVETPLRDHELGRVFTHTHVPDKGTIESRSPPPPKFSHQSADLPGSHSFGRGGASLGKLPRMNFPSFDA